MAFKGLADRYNKTYQDLYKLPVKTLDSDEPFLSVRPDDPAKNDVANDSQQIFPGTIKRETLRLARYLKSPRGLMFVIRQAELQTGNAFSETRIYDPLFVGSLIDPFVHIQRPLNIAAATDPSGIDGVSPASDGQIGMAGRLQLSTKNVVIGNRMGAKGATGLLNLILPGNPLSRAVSAVMSATQDIGIVGVNDRPEIDFQGEYFSVATWRGFRSQGKQGDPLVTVGSKLASGDFAGALSALYNGVKQTLSGGSAGTLGTLVDRSSDRGSGFKVGDTSNAGYRYFVTNGSDPTAIDRYLKDVIQFTSVSTGVPGQTREVPRVHMAPWVITPKNTVASTFITLDSTQSFLDSARKVQNDINSTLRSIKRIGSFLFGGNPHPTQTFKPLSSLNINLDGTSNLDLNPAQSRMIYPDLSLQSRYDAQKASFSSTDEQIVNWKKTYSPYDINTINGRLRGNAESRTYGIEQKSAGFGGSGLKPDYQSNLDSLSSPRQTPSYVIGDDLNLISATFDNDGDEVSDSMLNQIRDAGHNLIDFLFYDFGSSTILPFRAFLTDINQTVTPNVVEQQFIGRIERNIVYVGVARELSFTFRVQAFSFAEMTTVWEKINYLTGLAYPSSYQDGFLVPPLIKLTIGNLYKDQPGYIKNMSHKFDDDDWEIDNGQQVPMGVTINMSFSVIEKEQMSTGSKFYSLDGFDVNVPDIGPLNIPPIDIPDIVLPSFIPGFGTPAKASVNDAISLLSNFSLG